MVGGGLGGEGVKGKAGSVRDRREVAGPERRKGNEACMRAPGHSEICGWQAEQRQKAGATGVEASVRCCMEGPVRRVMQEGSQATHSCQARRMRIGCRREVRKSVWRVKRWYTAAE